MQIQTCLTPRAQEQDLGIHGQKLCVCNVNIYICLHNDCPSSPEERSRNFQGMSHSKLNELSKTGKRKLALYCSIQGAWGSWLRGGCLLCQYLKWNEPNATDLGSSKQSPSPPDSPILPQCSPRAGGDGTWQDPFKEVEWKIRECSELFPGWVFFQEILTLTCCCSEKVLGSSRMCR